MHHPERHFTERIGWLRASVLGANDGIISTASLILGVAAAGVSHEAIIVAGVAALVAGAMSMAAGEFVSVSSQADLEKADLKREQLELETEPESEHLELANIYEERGLSSDLAHEVATQLMDHDALAAHARDELGLSLTHQARPLQAAWTSAASFSIGAGLPLSIAWLTDRDLTVVAVSLSSLVFLALLGIAAAFAGGAGVAFAALRVTLWGGLAMAITYWIGSLI